MTVPRRKAKRLFSKGWNSFAERPETVPLAYVSMHFAREWNLTRAFSNNLFGVWWCERETRVGVVVHLAISRWFEPERRGFPWADLQRIKNEIAGEDATAVQVFPPADKVVDQAPMAHLWVVPDGFLPFDLGEPAE